MQTITNYFTADQEATYLAELDAMTALELIQTNKLQLNLLAACGETDVMHARSIKAKLVLIQDVMISRMGS